MADNFTQQDLHRWFDYDEMTGVLYKKGTKQSAGRVNNYGYLRMWIKGTALVVHRVIWLYMTGEWPEHTIDHINHKKTDNRMCNLRAVTQQENQFNCLIQINNTSGHTGIWRNKIGNKWRAGITLNNKNIHLGFFTLIDDAIAAREAGKLKYHKIQGLQ